MWDSEDNILESGTKNHQKNSATGILWLTTAAELDEVLTRRSRYEVMSRYDATHKSHPDFYLET